jgi:hypothetical protein
MSDDLTPIDRDAMIRTVIGEAGNQGPEGMAAVAHTILNRTVSGRYGSSPAAVVLAPGQYEPWQTRRQELLSYSPNSPAYQQAGGIVDAVAAGDVPDATGGATHFLNPAVVMQRRGSLPGWASKPVAKVGQHVFYAPEGKASGADAIGAINEAIGSDTSSVATPNSALAFSDDSSSPGGNMFRSAGFAAPGDTKTSANKGPVSVSPVGKPASMFEAAGFVSPGSAPAAPAVNSEYPTPEKFAAGAAQYGVNTSPEKPYLQQIREAIDPARVAASVAADALKEIPQSYEAGGQLRSSGVQDLRNGNYLPSFPSSDPSTWSGGGLLKTAGGALAQVASPVTGSINALVTNPVTQLTGNPDIGERAGDVAGLLIPGKGAAKVAEKAGPTAQSVNKLIDAIGPENVPAVVERLKSNPRLAVADVSDPVRTMTQGLVDPAQPKAQNAISEAVKSRIAAAPDAVNSAYTQSMGPAPDVVRLVEGLKERARAAGRKAIQPALENANLVDTSPVIQAIDEKLAPGVNPLLNPKSQLPLSAEQEELARIKQQLISGSGEQLFDAQRLHRIQSDIGDRAYHLTQSPDPKDRLLGGQLRDMNEKLIDQIDEAAGGAYRPARQKFKDAKDISAAFESGFDTLKNRPGFTGATEDTPQALSEWLGKASPEEIMARKLGTRADIENKMKTAKNQALAGETITRVEYNRDKLRMLFGDQEANRLIRTMEDTRDMATTNAKLIANSKTAETLAGQKALAVPKVGGGNPLQIFGPVAAEMLGQSAGLPIVGGAAAVAAKGLHMGAQKLGKMNALARNTEFAKAAMATGQARQLLMNRLISHPKVVRAARQ